MVDIICLHHVGAKNMALVIGLPIPKSCERLLIHRRGLMNLSKWYCLPVGKGILMVVQPTILGLLKTVTIMCFIILETIMRSPILVFPRMFGNRDWDRRLGCINVLEWLIQSRYQVLGSASINRF
ncbi:hypothetical protein D3C81_1812230 [compost metagenome]